MSLFAWVKAWEKGMAEHGYPKARLEPFEDDEGLTYTWLVDMDSYFGFTADLSEAEFSEAWQIAHMVFVLVDGLRPDEIRPSPKLLELLCL